MRLTLISAGGLALVMVGVWQGVDPDVLVVACLVAFVIAMASLVREMAGWEWPVIRLRRHVKPKVVEVRMALNDRASAVFARAERRTADAAKRLAEKKQKELGDGN